MKKLLKLVLLLAIGIAVGIGGTLLVTKRNADQRVPYGEVVVQPTRKKTLSYTNDRGTYTFENQKKKLCVVTYLKYKTGYAFALYQLTELPIEEQK